MVEQKTLDKASLSASVEYGGASAKLETQNTTMTDVLIVGILVVGLVLIARASKGIFKKKA